MIPTPIEHSQYQQNALHDSNVSRTTQLRHTSFVEYFCLSTFWNFTIKASVATKRRENKVKALKELAKETPHKDVASLFGVPKNNLSTWKNNKDKIFEKYKAALFQKD